MKKIAVLLTTVLTAGMLAACGQGKNAETTSAGSFRCENRSRFGPGGSLRKTPLRLNWEWWTRMEAISIREPWPLRKK